MKPSRIVKLAMFGVVFFGAVETALGDVQYSFITIDVPGAIRGSFGYGFRGINSGGQIAGFFTDAAFKLHGFLDTAGSFTTIDAPGANYTFVYGINNGGQIVGAYGLSGPSGPVNHGFVESGGLFTTIDFPGSTQTTQNGAFGINNAGHIVGAYDVHGYLESTGSSITIDFPGATFTEASGVNDTGQIVGTYGSGPANHGFLDSGGRFTSIDFPGATFTSASEINDTGQIVGTYGDATGIHSFLDSGGLFTRVDFPGATETVASGINDAGEIVGTYADAIGSHGFLATPTAAIPEPRSLPVLAGCLIGLLAIVYCQKLASDLKGDRHENF